MSESKKNGNGNGSLNRTMTESELVKTAQNLATQVLDETFTDTQINVSDLCEAFCCSKSLAEKIYIKAMPQLIASGKALPLVDDKVASKIDLPYVNSKGTLVIPTEAMKALPNFEELKAKQTKYQMEEHDGTITLTPVA